MFMLRLCVSTLKEYHRENKKTYVYLSGATALICSEKDEAADSVVILIPDATYFSIKAILFLHSQEGIFNNTASHST